MATPTKKEKTTEEYYEEARKELLKYGLRTATVERDYAAQWMGSARQFQDYYNQTLGQLEEARRDISSLLQKLETYRRELALKDRSFQPPHPASA